MKAAAARANAVTWDKGSGVRPGSQWVVHIGFGAAKVKQRVFSRDIKFKVSLFASTSTVSTVLSCLHKTNKNDDYKINYKNAAKEVKTAQKREAGCTGRARPPHTRKRVLL